MNFASFGSFASSYPTMIKRMVPCLSMNLDLRDAADLVVVGVWIAMVGGGAVGVSRRRWDFVADGDGHVELVLGEVAFVALDFRLGRERPLR